MDGYDPDLLALIYNLSLDGVPKHLASGAFVLTDNGSTFILKGAQLVRLKEMEEVFDEMGIIRVEWLIDEFEIHDLVQEYTDQILKQAQPKPPLLT